MLNDKFCNRCGSSLHRVNRTALDKLISRFIPHIRAKCSKCDRSYRVKTDFGLENEINRKQYMEEFKALSRSNSTKKKPPQ